MCVGEIILYISIVIQVLIYVLFIISSYNIFGLLKVISISVPYSLFLYIWSKLWFQIIGNMCKKDLDYESIIVLLSPLVLLIVSIICYFIGVIFEKIFDFGAGKKIKDIKLTSEFKNYIDGNTFEKIEYDDKKKYILEKYGENTTEKNLSNELFLDNLWTIKNLVNNPYSFEIIGKKRNVGKRGLIIIDNKTNTGWNGYLKIVNFNREVDSNIDNYSKTEYINNEEGYKITIKTGGDYQDLLVIEGVGNDRGIYSCTKNISVLNIILNLVSILILLYICYLVFINY